MLTSEWHREDLANDILFESSREERRPMLDQEFFDKIDWLTKKLKELRPQDVKIEVIEKKVVEPKERHKRWKNFNRHPDNFRKLWE